jgi:tRNA pseudouridine(55) synthase
MKPAFLVIDKPPGITSHDVVAAVRAVTGIKKVGHTGTLDPFATGVLPLALSAATRLIQFVDEQIKVYDATILFGAATDTGDPTGVVVKEAPKPSATRAEVEEVLRTFLGSRMQTPPAYSAVKHEGKPLYHYARKGEEVSVPARPILIHDLTITSYDHDRLRLLITCSRGTYARVLADEISVALGSAGHLEALSRPRSGPFYLEDALSMDRLAAMVSSEPDRPWQDVLLSRGKGAGPRVQWRPRDEVMAQLEPYLRRPVAVLSHLPLADVRGGDAIRIRRGGHPPPPPPGCAMGGKYLVVSGDDVVAVVEATPRGPKTLKVVDESEG